MWQVMDDLFLPLEMSQNSIDYILVLNTSNDPDRTTAAAANLNVDIENSLESLGPGHCGMTLSRRTNFRIGERLHTFATLGRGDLPTPSVVRCQYAVVASEIDPGLGNQCRQSGYEIHRIEGHLCRAIPIGRLQGIDHLAGGTQ